LKGSYSAPPAAQTPDSRQNGRQTGLAVQMALRGRNDGAFAPAVLPALGAWKPAKDAGFHISTTTATAAAKLDKLPNPRQSHVIPDSCAEPKKAMSFCCVFQVLFPWTYGAAVVRISQVATEHVCKESLALCLRVHMQDRKIRQRYLVGLKCTVALANTDRNNLCRHQNAIGTQPLSDRSIGLDWNFTLHGGTKCLLNAR